MSVDRITNKQTPRFPMPDAQPAGFDLQAWRRQLSRSSEETVALHIRMIFSSHANLPSAAAVPSGVLRAPGCPRA